MIRVGEVGGTLPQSFYNLYEDSAADNKLQSDVKGAMMYPAIILSILILVVLLLFLFVLPQLTSFFDQAGIEVPLSTRLIMSSSKFMKQYFVYIFIFLAIVLGSAYFAVKKSPDAKKIIDQLVKIKIDVTQVVFPGAFFI